jgi:hypothetical protein
LSDITNIDGPSGVEILISKTVARLMSEVYSQIADEKHLSSYPQLSFISQPG